MGFSEAGRAQSNVVGAVLLFGFLILAIAVYQAQIVPAENADVEFEHSQLVENDAVDLRNAILNAGSAGEPRSASVKLGTRYPQRTFFVNPPPATGSVTTSDTRAIRIENASVDADGNAGAFWNESDLVFDTKTVRYASEYNVYGEAPDLVYEHSMLLAEFEGAVMSRTGQTAVKADPNRLSLTLIEGNLSTSGIERAEFDAEPLSKSERSVRLVPDDDAVDLVLPTTVDVENADRAADLERRWEEQFGENATATVTDGAVHVTIETEEPVRLRLAQVGVGSDATEPEPAYLTRVAGSGGSPVVEVRDRFNNPVEGAMVNVTVNGEERDPVVTDEDGRAEYTIDTDEDPLRPTVRMFLDESYEGSEEWERKRFRSVTGGGSGGGGDGGGGNVNPGEDGDIVLTDVGIRNGQRLVDLQFKNEGDEDRSLEMMQFTLYYSPQGDTQDSVTIQDTGQEIQLRGPFVDLEEPVVIPEGETATLTLEFDENAAGDLLGVSFVTDENQEVMYLTGLDGTLKPQPEFEVTIDETNSPVTEGDPLEVTATVENVGDETDTQSLELEIDGDVVDQTDEFTLEPGESNQETLIWETEEGDAGEYTATVRSEDSADEVDVTVVEEDEPAGNVDVQDQIVETDEEFEVTTGGYLNLNEGYLVVENEDNADDEVAFSEVDEGTYQVQAADIGGYEPGDDVTAVLYEDDSRTNELNRDTTTVEFTSFGVFAFVPENFNNDNIDAQFDIEGYTFEVDLAESGNNWDRREVIIDGETFVLTETAADEIVDDDQERDLLDPTAYEDVDEGLLESIEEDIQEEDLEVDVDNEGDRALEVEIREQ